MLNEVCNEKTFSAYIVIAANILIFYDYIQPVYWVGPQNTALVYREDFVEGLNSLSPSESISF